MAENGILGVPEEFLPLYQSNNAHDIIRNAVLLIRDSDTEDQKSYLESEAFTSIVTAALDGLDSCWDEHVVEILSAFAEENIEEAKKIFG